MSTGDGFVLTVPVTAGDSHGLEQVDVVAYPTTTPGLVVHRQPFDPKRWVVTHQASGTTITGRGWPDYSCAAAYAARLGSLADWTQDQHRLRALGVNAGLGVRARMIEHDLCGELGLHLEHNTGAEVVVQVDGVAVEEPDYHGLDSDELTQLITDVRGVHDVLVDELAARIQRQHHTRLVWATGSAASRVLDRTDRSAAHAARAPSP